MNSHKNALLTPKSRSDRSANKVVHPVPIGKAAVVVGQLSLAIPPHASVTFPHNAH
jgi:hypothetical protein